MAIGVAMKGENTHYNGRMTSFVVLSCAMAAMGGVIFGYDIGIAGLPLSLNMMTMLKLIYCSIVINLSQKSTFLLSNSK